MVLHRTPDVEGLFVGAEDVLIMKVLNAPTYCLIACVSVCACLHRACTIYIYMYVFILIYIHIIHIPSRYINHDLQTIKKIHSRILFSQAAFCFPWKSGEHCHRQSGQVELLGLRSVQDLWWVEDG